MKCPVRSGENTEILVDYCARTLDGERAALLERHMIECRECQAFRDAQSTAWESLDAWQPPAVSPDFNQRLFARLEEEEQKPWWQQWRGPWTAVLLEPAMPIAVTGLAVLAGLLFQATLPVPAASPALQGQMQVRLDSTEIDQAETALQDLEMLRVLPDVVPAVESADHPI